MLQLLLLYCICYIYNLHWSTYNVRRTLYVLLVVHRAVYIVSWRTRTMYAVHFTYEQYAMFTVRRTMFQLLHNTALIIQIYMYIVQCTLYSVHCTVYSVQCTLYSVHCTKYTVHCTLYNVHCTMYIVQYTCRFE